MKKNKLKTITKNGFLFLIAFLVLFGIKTTVAQAAANSTLSFNPNTPSQLVGDNFTIDAVVGPGSHTISATDLYITFDHTKLRLDSITPSATFSEIHGATAVDNNNGTAYISVNIPVGSPGVTDSTVLATYHFHALATAAGSSVAFTSSSILGSDDESGVNELDMSNGLGTAQVTITVSYSVTPSIGTGSGHGSISPGTVQTITGGSAAQFTITPDSGYTASVGGTCGGSLVGTTYTTGAITGDCTVIANFATTFYTVTSSAGAHGSILPSGTQPVASGSTTTFTVTPNAGYTSSVDGTCGGSLVGTTYTTNTIAGNCTVTATFADTTAPTFTVNDGTSATAVKTDTINITVADTGTGVSAAYYGHSNDSTCNSSDTINTDFSSGVGFDIAGNYTDYLCVRAIDNASPGNVSYQLIGQLHTDNTAPTISAEAASNISTTGARITWTTNEAANSQVEYGLDTGYGSTTILSTSMVTPHSQNITGLTADTDYHYRAISADVAGNSATSAIDHTFHTASATQVVLPVADPLGGTYSSSQSVTLTTSTDGATIYYTTDGSDPTSSSVVYSSAITVDSNLTLKAIAIKSGSPDSNIMTEDYVINADSDDTQDDTDISNPKIKIGSNVKSFPHSKSVYSKSKSFKLKGNDSNLADGEVVVYKNGNKWKTVDVDSDGDWSVGAKVSKDESYKFKFHYYSATGDNLGTSGTYVVKVDSEKPTFTDLPLALTKRAGDKVWWTAKDNKDVDHYKYTLNGKKTKTKDVFFIMPSLSWGPHILTVTAYDKAGNSESRNVMILFR